MIDDDDASIFLPARLRAQDVGRWLPRMLRGMLPTMLLDGVGPMALYMGLRPRYPPASAVPLAIAILLPLLGNAWSIARRRRLDTFGVMIIISLPLSLGALLLSGDQRSLLLTRDLAGPAMGITALGSLLLPKPLAFYMIRQFTTGDDPTRGAAFDRLWRHRYVRFAARFASAVWGVTMLGEFAVRVVLVFTLSVGVALVILPIIQMTVSLGLGAWNLVYGVHVARRIQGLRGD